MKNFKILIIAIAATTFAITSCSKHKGYKESDNGLFYKFYNQGEKGQKPQMGDVLTLNLMYKTDKDSVLENTKERPQPFMIILREPEFKGDLYEGLAMMHKGDSASFIIKGDSFFLVTAKLQKLPEIITNETNLIFEVKLVDIKPKAIFEKEMQEARAKFEEEMLKRKDLEKTEIDNFLKANKITTKPTKNGLYYVEVEKGKGQKAENGKTVFVHYTGKFLDGKVFDSSVGQPQPFQFVIGQGQVIKGWEEGIALMSKGGKAKLIIPSILGYGEKGYADAILPFTPLHFEVELIDIK